MASACSMVVARDPSSLLGGAYPTNRLGTKASSCMLMSVTVVCVCVMVVCGVLVVREYSLAANYAQTSCRLTNITYASDILCTHCSGIKDKNREKGTGSGSSCTHIHFPCVRIIVSYRFDGSQNRSAMLYENSVEAAGQFSQCSYHVCLKTREDNKKMVEDFADQWRSKLTSFPCYYDTDDHDKVIAHKTYSTADVIHSMLWPSLAIIVCGAVFLYLETRRRGLTLCGSKGQAAGEVDNNGNPQDLLPLRENVTKEKWSGSPAVKNRLVHGNHHDATGTGSHHLASSKHGGKMSCSMSSLEKVSTRGGGGGGGGGGKASPRTMEDLLSGGGSKSNCERLYGKKKTASVDRLADMRLK